MPAKKFPTKYKRTKLHAIQEVLLLMTMVNKEMEKYDEVSGDTYFLLNDKAVEEVHRYALGMPSELVAEAKRDGLWIE